MNLSRFAIATAALLAACGGTEASSTGTDDTPGTSIAASPSTVSVTDKAPDTTVYLSTTPSGGRLHWQVAAKPAWLTVTPDHGVVQGITPIKISGAATPAMEPGTTSGRLDLVASGGTASIQVALTLSPNPLLSVSAPNVSIGATIDTSAVVLTNPGRGATSWTVSGQPTWLSVTPTSGFIPTGGSNTVKLAPNRGPLPAGTSTGSLLFKNTGTSATLTVGVAVDVAAAPRAAFDASRLVFSPGTSVRTLTLSNAGKGPLTWQTANKDSWLTVAPSSGTLQAGDTTHVSVSSIGAPGSSGGFTITSNAVDAPSVRVATLVVASAPPTGLSLLDHHVIDAEFNAANGLLVTVSASPARLNAFDMETGDSWFIALPKDPCCVAIRSDGRFAAVAHDALVSYVDLSTHQVVKTYPITSDAFDVVLPTNGYLYVWPRTDQWVNVHAVNLTTGAEENGADLIYAGSHSKLHPSGTFAYDIWYLSPADLEKFDLSGGKPRRLGDSPYHGDFPMGYSLWFSPGGDHILTEAGTIFRSSTSAADDMRYMGRLPSVGGARMLTEDPVRQRIYAFAVSTSVFFSGVDPATRTGEIKVFDSANLNALGQVSLPKMVSGGKQVDVDGFYLFPSSDGRRLYMLVKAVLGSGVSQDWALYVVDASTLP